MGQIIACGNLKGGVGKTTLAVNLACALAARGRSVVLLDLDPLGGAAAWAAAGRLPVQVEAAPAGEEQRTGPWPARVGELAGAGCVVVLDLPPLLLPTLASALIIADVILVPITPSALDGPATLQTLRSSHQTRKSRPGGRPKRLLAPNCVDPRQDRTLGQQPALAEMAEGWAPAVRQHADHIEAVRMGRWTGEFAPHSPATADVVALADALEGVLASLVRRP